MSSSAGFRHAYKVSTHVVMSLTVLEGSKKARLHAPSRDQAFATFSPTLQTSNFLVLLFISQVFQSTEVVLPPSIHRSPRVALSDHPLWARRCDVAATATSRSASVRASVKNIKVICYFYQSFWGNASHCIVSS